MSETQQISVPVESGVEALTGHRVVRVNLLPEQIGQARRLRQVQAGLAVGLLAVVGVAGAVYYLESSARKDAAAELATVQAETSRLKAEEAQYADVPRTLARIDAVTSARQTAMATDVAWDSVFTDFALNMPPNVWFTKLGLEIGGPAAVPATPPTGGQPGAAGAKPETASATGIGLVTIDGYAIDHPDVAKWLDTLGQRPGMTDSSFTTSTKEKAPDGTLTVKFSSTATLTSDALRSATARKQG
ncbi:MAG: PilN domain-containing protein [Actinomycetota bacterium]